MKEVLHGFVDMELSNVIVAGDMNVMLNVELDNVKGAPHGEKL